MIKRETVVSLLAGLLVGALGIAPVVAGDGLGNFGPAQGGGGGVTDAELVAIGALTPTDGNVIVGDGSTWVAESGATARASLGALGGSLGSTDNAIPRADGTGGVTAQGSDATLSDAELLDLTATGALALGAGTNDPRLVKSSTDTLAVRDGSGNSSWIASLGMETKDLSAYTTAAGAEAKNGNLRSVILGSAFGGAIVSSGYKFGWSSTTAGSADVGTTDDTALSRSAAGTVLVENGSGTGATLHVGAGSASAVALGLNADANTGLYGTADSVVGVAIGGTTIAAVGTVGLTARSYTEAVTGNYTLANAQSLQVFHNTGAGGAITIELGSITATGFSATFVATDNQDITLNPGNSDKFVGIAGGWADGEAMLVDDQNDAVRITRLSTGDWLVEWTRGTLTEETP